MPSCRGSSSLAVPSDERPSIHGDVVAVAGGHMEDEHMLLSKRSSLKENGEWLLASMLLHIQTYPRVMFWEKRLLLLAPGDADVQQATTKERMANRSLGGADDLMDLSSSQTMKLAGRDDKGSCPDLFDKS
ncbi:hypothetical protein Nepgr_030915 [Nepenthes gracilis]|uniref:Uncharacterized protein n=1 Tax=Nepenthes gracilis TaxID=150966 RepID=A0AAD3THW8_NEPGR|nr:hypothetical protein Nepgr_030915 [Nepenthes gracilis]